MPVGGTGPWKLRKLSAELRAAGTQGQGLRRELYKAVNEAAKPLTAEVKSPENLRSHMPARYAAVLGSDLAVTAVKRGGHDPGISIRARSRVRKRKVVQLDAGVISHPLFGDRKHWYRQARGVRAGFFIGVMERSSPEVRDKILAAMHDVGRKITS